MCFFRLWIKASILILERHHFFLLQNSKHISHTSGELHDSEMSEGEIIEVGIIFSVHAIVMLIINSIMLKLIFDSAAMASCVCHNNIIIHNY